MYANTLSQVPSPNEDQVNDTTKCMAKCEQGNGTEEQTKKYADCQQKCISDHFYVSSEGTPNPTGSPNNNGNGSNSSKADGSQTSGAARPSSSGADSEDDDEDSTSTSGSPSSTGGASESTESPGAAASLVASSATLFGLLAAVFAL